MGGRTEGRPAVGDDDEIGQTRFMQRRKRGANESYTRLPVSAIDIIDPISIS